MAYTVKLTEEELEYIITRPEVLLAIADFHDTREAMADGIGMNESANHHRRMAIHYRAESEKAKSIINAGE